MCLSFCAALLSIYWSDTVRRAIAVSRAISGHTRSTAAAWPSFSLLEARKPFGSKFGRRRQPQ